jgi:hypothetical protein
MPTCPNGHHNPRNQQLCSVCDALIVPAERRPLSARKWWVIIALSGVAAVMLAAVLGVVITHRTEPENASAPTTAESTAMRQWWSAAHTHFDELQRAVGDTQAGLKRQDGAVLQKSCQVMHDAGVVLRAHLPAPNPDLTAELDAAINDAHEAAHMCLAAINGSQNNYAGEFAANLDQAEKHLAAALAIVNKSLLKA